MSVLIQLTPVAFVSNSRTRVEDDHWGGVLSEIHLEESLESSCFEQIDSFSHLEILYYFDKVSPDKIIYSSRYPRNNPNWPEVGIFAQRGKNRPNQLGICIVELVEVRERYVVVKGLDALDQTPVLDIKPVMQEFLPKTTIRQPQWSRELMKDYW